MATTEIALETRVAMPPSSSNLVDGPLPTYNEDPTDTAESPSSHKSFFRQLRGARSPRAFLDSLGACALAAVACCGTVCVIIVILVLNVVPIAMVVVGSMNLHNCPVQPYIPIFLIVGGSVCLGTSLVGCCCSCFCKRDSDDSSKQNPIHGIVSIFLLGWFIAGAVWVFGTFRPNFDAGSGNSAFCDPATYYFSFAVITIFFSVFVLVILCVLFGLMIACCCFCCCKD